MRVCCRRSSSRHPPTSSRDSQRDIEAGIDYFELLGVREEAEAAEVVSAFRARVRAVHPDANTGGGDPERVALLVRARSALTGPGREAYEGSLRAHRAKRAMEANRERREARQREREEALAEAKRVLKETAERARYRRARWDARLPVIEDGVEVFPEEWDAAPTERDAHGHIEGSSRRAAVDPTPYGQEVDDDDNVRWAQARAEELLARARERAEENLVYARARAEANLLAGQRRVENAVVAGLERAERMPAAARARETEALFARGRAEVEALRRRAREDIDCQIRLSRADIDNALSRCRR